MAVVAAVALLVGPDLEIKNVRCMVRNDAPRLSRVTGLVVNNGNRPVRRIVVEGVFYDSEGGVIDVNQRTVRDIGVGQSVPFEIPATDTPDGAKIARCGARLIKRS